MSGSEEVMCTEPREKGCERAQRIDVWDFPGAGATLGMGKWAGKFMILGIVTVSSSRSERLAEDATHSIWGCLISSNHFFWISNCLASPLRTVASLVFAMSFSHCALAIDSHDFTSSSDFPTVWAGTNAKQGAVKPARKPFCCLLYYPM